MIRRTLATVVAALVLAACRETPPPAGKPLAAASFYPLYDFARQVAGDRADVVSLVPPGVEPHDWEPPPQSVVEVQRARMLVYNGAGFEPWVARLTRDTAAGGALLVDATRGLELLTVDGAPDPHVWLDPVLAQAQVETIRVGFAQIDPASAETYARNARALAARLSRLDETFAAGLRDCARRDIVTSHAAFTYLARRYRLTQIPVMGLAPEAEPSPAELAAIATLARRRQARYIFFETLVSSRLAETLAREIGAGTLVLNPIEGLSAAEAAAGKDYVSVMEANLATLRTGLECR